MYPEDVIFTERQRFHQWWLWVILLGIPVIILAVLYANGESIPGFSIPLMFLPIVLLLMMRLDVTVQGDRLRVRFFPLMSKTILVSEIVEHHARQYRPIAEYGGWGIRYGFSVGWAYNVSGNQGVQLVLTDGKKILIGSQCAEELDAAISRAQGRK